MIWMLVVSALAEDPPVVPAPEPVPAPTAPEPAPEPAPDPANVGESCRTDGDCIGPETICRKPAPGAKAAGIVGAGKLVVGTCTVPGAPCTKHADCGEPHGECDDGTCAGNEE
jgi:hypothetical protein